MTTVKMIRGKRVELTIESNDVTMATHFDGIQCTDVITLENGIYTVTIEEDVDERYPLNIISRYVGDDKIKAWDMFFGPIQVAEPREYTMMDELMDDGFLYEDIIRNF